MDTKEAVQRRIALATPDACVHGQFYDSTLVALAELYGPEVAEEAFAAVRSQTVRAPFSCPIADLLRLSDAGASAAERRVGVAYEQAMERMGGCLGRDFLASPLGRALWPLTGRDVHQALRWSISSARASSTFGERDYEKLGPSSASLLFRRELMGPAWVRGLYLEVLQSVAARRLVCTVEAVQEPGLAFNLRFSW